MDAVLGRGTYGSIHSVEDNPNTVFKLSSGVDGEPDDTFFDSCIITEILMSKLIGKHQCITACDTPLMSEQKQGFLMEKCRLNLCSYVATYQASGFNQKALINNSKHILYNIISGLIHLHDKGIIHTDLSLGNVMLKFDNSMSIIDFGLSRIQDDCGVFNILKILGADHIDCFNSKNGRDTSYTTAYDMWSVGKIAYQIVTQMVSDDKFLDPPDVCDYTTVGDSDLDDLIVKLLDPTPEKRLTARQALEHPFFSSCGDNVKRRLQKSSPLFYRDEAYYKYLPRRIEVDESIRLVRSRIIITMFSTLLLTEHEFCLAVRLMDIYWQERNNLESNYVDNITILAIMIIVESIHTRSGIFKHEVLQFLTTKNRVAPCELFRTDILYKLNIPDGIRYGVYPDSDSDEIIDEHYKKFSGCSSLIFKRCVEILEFFDYRLYYDYLTYHIKTVNYLEICVSEEYLLNNHRLAEFVKEM